MTDAGGAARSTRASTTPGTLAQPRLQPERGAAAAPRETKCDPPGGARVEVAADSTTADSLPLALRRLGEAFATFDAAVRHHAREPDRCDGAAVAPHRGTTLAPGDASP